MVDMVLDEKIKIMFGAINPVEREVVSSDSWNIKEDPLGLFFISGVSDEITSASIELLAEGNVRVWSSSIKQLPEETLTIDGKSECIYISSRVIDEESLSEWGNGNYTVALDYENADKFYLTVEGFNESNELKYSESEETTSEEYVLEEDDEDTLVAEEYVLDEEDENKEVSVTEEYVLEEDDEDTLVAEEYVLDEEDENKEVSVTEEYVLDEEDIVSDVAMYENGSMGVEAEERDVRDLLIRFGFKHKPFSINCCDIDEPVQDSKKKDIVIEKILDSNYVVEINNLLPRQIHLYDGENSYFKFEGPIDEFMKKIKKLIKRSYGITEDEFRSMEKLVISDGGCEKNHIEDESIEYVNRGVILDTIKPDEGKLIIDVYGKECNILYRKDKEMIRLKCSELTSDNKLDVYADLKEVIKAVGIDNIDLTGELSIPQMAELLGVIN